ncbi:MAG: very short patch repair endonuclease [Acidobacteriaceae bacterium]
MVDRLTPAQRSRLMARVPSEDTAPEKAVRKLLWSMGLRYRLHAKELPGRPDIVFRSRKKAIFVHGCFWHRHSGCTRNSLPTTRRAFWRKKLEGNAERDRKNYRLLRRAGYRVLVIWECELRRSDRVFARLRRFLELD